MKTLLIAAALALPVISLSQEIRTSEQNVSFSNGSHNAVVVTVPYGKLEVVEKEMKSELKDWGGKYGSSKGEMSSAGASMKSMGDKPFDGYARILSSTEDEIKVAFAVDLGGAYMDSRSHGAQYKVIESQARKFAMKASHGSIDDDLAVQGKLLKEMEKDKSDYEKSIERSRSDIEEYKKKIAEAEKSIENNTLNIEKKTGEIGTQSTRIGDIEKKKKAVKS
jgi:hypothetical protein